MSELKKTAYTAQATADYGRDGSVATSDGTIDIALVKPPGMGGEDGAEGTNPEQLFAAGYAACFHGALLFHARAAKVDVTDSSVTSKVHIGPVEQGGLGLAVELDVRLPNVEQERAEELASKAHDACPYSRATRGNIAVEVAVIGRG